MQNELQRLIYNLQKMVLIFKSGILATIPLCLGSSTSTTWGAPDFLSERNPKKIRSKDVICVLSFNYFNSHVLSKILKFSFSFQNN